MVEAIVEFDYKAEQPDELTLSKGDIIHNIVQQDGGWWSGVLNGRKGVFPDNFVRLLEKKKRRKCIVLFSYAPANSDELELKVDQEIEILEEVEEGWWKGRLDNKTGVFPSNFVKVVNNDQIAKKTDRIQENKQENIKKSPNLSKKTLDKPLNVSEPELCRAVFTYTSVNNDELNLQAGDIVTILNKETQEPGWWEGELNGKVGVFPDNFVEIIQSDASSSLRKKSNNAKKKSIELENDVENSVPALKTPPLLPKKPKAPPAQDAIPSETKRVTQESKPVVLEPHISVPDGKLLPPAEPKSTPPAAEETKHAQPVAKVKGVLKNDFDSVPRSDLLAQPLRPKAPRRRPPSNALKQNGHSESFEDKVDMVPEKRTSLEVKNIPKVEETPPPPIEVLREPVKIEPKKSPFMEELKGIVNQVKRDKPPAKPRPLSVGLAPVKAPLTSPRKSPLEEVKPSLPEKPLEPKEVAPLPPPKVLPEKKNSVADEVLKFEDSKKVSLKPLSLEERVKELEETVRRLASALREETRNRLRLEEEVERLTNRVVQI